MCPGGDVQGIAGVDAAALDVIVLDATTPPIARREIAAAIRSILAGRVAEVARDRNSVCYRIRLSGDNGTPGAAIVKLPRPGPQRTNDDATFVREAAMLARLPAAGIVGAPAFLARVVTAGRHFLFMTELPGRHPDARTHPLDGRQLHAILDGLYAMDCRRLMHYDLKAANILIDSDRAGFIDFEFARFEDAYGAYAANAAAFCEDFNVSGNPHFPTRSNVANFEFRALHRYLLDLAAARSADAVATLLGEWLRGKSAYHAQMSGLLAGLSETSAGRFAASSAITADQARRSLLAAAAYEELLAAVFRDPHDAVVRVERSVMAFRCAVFERCADEARQLHDAAMAEIGTGGQRSDALPDAYRQATARTIDLVGRSHHRPS